MAKRTRVSATRFVTPAEAAEFTGLSQRTLRRDVADGKLRAYRRGHITRYRIEDLEALFTPTDAWRVA